MRVGIIRYPCSNGDNDMLQYFKNSFFIWHKETILPDDIDLLVIPGGFAYGDRYYQKATGKYEIKPGKMAVESPCTKIIMDAVRKDIPVLGVCNGFQILIELGLLPGKLIMNDEKQFIHKTRKCFIHGQEMELIVANKYGKYISNIDTEIFMKYEDDTVAGIKKNNIYGIMPHPERTNNELFKSILEMEIAIQSVMSSEHITYKSSKKYLQLLPTKAPQVIVPPGENAGIVDIGNGYGLVVKIESHNHPLMVDAYQASATGVGGAIRDIFTMGGTPIGLLDFLRFDKENNPLVNETIRGIADYGNCIGVPNIGGDFLTNSCFKNNPLINVACIGIVKLDNIVYGRVRNVDDMIIYVGNTTGMDGVGGTCMASKQLETNINKDYDVQLSDPFLEKLLLEACNECSDNHFLEGMQDMGAGGLLCSAVELIQRGNCENNSFGCNLFIDKIPTRCAMKFGDILTSESQERMILVCKPSNYENIQNIFHKWDLECHHIGNVTSDNHFKILSNDKLVYDRGMDKFTSQTFDFPLKEYNPILEKDIVIKNKTLWEQYDSTIGCRTINGCLDYGDYSILNIPEINGQLMVTWGSSVLECHEKMKENANPLCIVNCLNFGDPNDIMKEFKDHIEKIAYEANLIKVPIIGGNVSLYNATNGLNIKGTPIIVMCGLIKT